MEIFKVNGTTYQGGQIIEGITKKTWIERYVEPGEFTLIAPVSSDLKSQLPLGTLISHSNTLELAMVEDHQITETKGKDPVIKVTGRTVDFFLENRLAIPNQFSYNNPATDAPYDDILAAAGSYTQAIILIRTHIMAAYQYLNSQENLPNVNVYYSNAPTEGTFYERRLKKGTVAERLYEILAFSGLGLKTIRPTYASSTLDFVVHKGLDRTTSVVFSHLAGDIEEGEYLWSNKKVKNAAIILGKYTATAIRPSGPTGFDVRTILVDASDYEVKYDEFSGSINAAIDRALYARGVEALGMNKNVEIVSIGISPNNRYKYRTEYNVGDRVKVAGNYGAVQTMQVTEHVEIEDEDGLTSYPTLSVV